MAALETIPLPSYVEVCVKPTETVTPITLSPLSASIHIILKGKHVTVTPWFSCWKEGLPLLSTYKCNKHISVTQLHNVMKNKYQILDFFITLIYFYAQIILNLTNQS